MPPAADPEPRDPASPGTNLWSSTP